MTDLTSAERVALVALLVKFGNSDVDADTQDHVARTIGLLLLHNPDAFQAMDIGDGSDIAAVLRRAGGFPD